MQCMHEFDYTTNTGKICCTCGKKVNTTKELNNHIELYTKSAESTKSIKPKKLIKNKNIKKSIKENNIDKKPSFVYEDIESQSRKTRIIVVFEFYTDQEAKDAYDHIKPYCKNITGIKRDCKPFYRRIDNIIDVVGKKRLSTKEIFKKINSSGVTYKTTQRDLRYLVLKGIFNTMIDNSCGRRSIFWRR